MFEQRESDLEKRICKYAKTKGWTPHKWAGPGERGKADRFFTKAKSRIFFMEIKRDDDEEPKPLQEHRRQELIKQGFASHVISSFEEAVVLFDVY